jgi:hypothetical protein
MHGGDSSLFLPRSAVSVRLRLDTGDPLAGEVFVMQRVAHRDGPETVLEMLNRPEEFFPFRPADGSPVLLVARAHTVTVTTDTADLLADPARREAAYAVPLSLALATGDSLTGEAWFEAPITRQRPLDYLNASRDPFFALVRDDVTEYVNRAHVRYAQPGA